MDQVFFRNPLKTNVINFDHSKVEESKFKSTFSNGSASGIEYHSRGVIPVYCPECDEIPLDFDEDDKKVQVDVKKRSLSIRKR